MIIIPAIDIRGGNSVRLVQGKVENETVHSNDPVSVAKLWRQKGAKRIHIVDLDAAIDGVKNNLSIIEKICMEMDLEIEVGGGIRSLERLEKIFDCGADFAILGTAAVQDQEFLREALKRYGRKIIVGVDVKDGFIAIKGWKEISKIKLDDFVKNISALGINQIIYTDISRDGMLSGPDFKGLEKLSAYGLQIIASGGIKSIDDLIKLKEKNINGLIGAIVGSALYTENFDLAKAIKCLA
ncbi:MAG: 1-(5-phosphoribosyl)-5-[(5-phosphoribosylamino)methylideneamino]imidazole-4-carboxamide isomerase [Elusimicrobiota bacterium]|nr:1-(5-phosphoribosyl)-5-[(5-phosphoribosylamino)methylideneamino]imidazole-4-carboxamide isomerase [Elusimicrobiota bacterium]